MTAILYWRERLEQGHPIRALGFRTKDWMKPRDEGADMNDWPTAVAKQALYADYLKWHDEVYLPPFEGDKYYEEYPDQIPEAMSESIFFQQLAPFLFVKGRAQTIVLRVPRQQRLEGEWVTVTTRQNFAGLASLKDHIRRYNELVGYSAAPLPPPEAKPTIKRVVVGKAKGT